MMVRMMIFDSILKVTENRQVIADFTAWTRGESTKRWRVTQLLSVTSKVFLPAMRNCYVLRPCRLQSSLTRTLQLSPNNTEWLISSSMHQIWLFWFFWEESVVPQTARILEFTDHQTRFRNSVWRHNNVWQILSFLYLSTLLWNLFYQYYQAIHRRCSFKWSDGFAIY